MNEAHIDLSGKLINCPSVDVGEVVDGFHQFRRNTDNFDLIETVDNTIYSICHGLYIPVSLQVLGVLEHRLDFVGAVKNTSGYRHTSVVHIEHQFVKYAENIFGSENSLVRSLSDVCAVSRISSDGSCPVVENLGNRVRIHFRELVFLVEHLGDVRNGSDEVGLVNILGMDKRRPFTLVDKRLGFPSIVVVSLCGTDGITVRICSTRGADRRNFDGLAVNPAETTVVWSAVKLSEI